MSQRIRWGILGTARISAKIVPAILDTPNAELVAVASRDADRAAEFAARYGIPQSFGDYRAVIEHPDIDAVYIPLPPTMHAEWTIRALAAGKHVLCEKPLAHSLAAALEMAAAAEEHARLLMDGVMWLHHPRAADMVAVLDAGRLGPLRRVTSAFSFLADQLAADDLRYQRALGGGSLLDLGWYCIGATIWALRSLPLRVWGSARFVGECDRRFSGMMWFADEVVSSFDCSFETTARRWFEIAGDRASLICDDFTRPWHEPRARCWLHEQTGKAEEIVSMEANQERCLVARFGELVQRGELGRDWLQRSLQVQAVCEALDRSARSGRSEEVALLPSGIAKPAG